MSLAGRCPLVAHRRSLTPWHPIFALLEVKSSRELRSSPLMLYLLPVRFCLTCLPASCCALQVSVCRAATSVSSSAIAMGPVCLKLILPSMARYPGRPWNAHVQERYILEEHSRRLLPRKVRYGKVSILKNHMCSSPNKACSIPHERRRENTLFGHTVTSQMARHST